MRATTWPPLRLTFKMSPPSSPAGVAGMYEYTTDLLCLDFCRRAINPPSPHLDVVTTQLVVEAWAQALSWHPDKAFARYICTGLRFGFRIGFSGNVCLKPAPNNMRSAHDHPTVVSEYLAKETALGRMLGPFDMSTSLCPLQINRFGVIPKGHDQEKWRLITDLSFPPGHSVNDGIDPTLCSLSYSTVDEVAGLVARLGPGALLAKIDIESAYRLIPVHPDDRPLLGMQWEGSLYVDPMLPFGLRSAPKVFNAVADALCWHLHQSGIPLLRHYLDDFIIVAPPHSTQCEESLTILDRECQTLGVPIAEHKRDGPTTCLTFLGIEVDTVAGELRLPAVKLQRLRTLLLDWGTRRSCTRKELESIIGLLNHACKVVRSGRAFLRRMLDLLHAVHRPPNSPLPIRLNVAFRADLAWWQSFVEHWNGVSFLLLPAHLPTVEMTSDASGSWGCGAWHLRAWFQVQWGPASGALSIAEQELIPIILGCAAWGHNWRGHRVVCHCDNQVVVSCLRSRTSKHKGIMHLVCCLVFVEATLGIFWVPTYINTKANHLADDLSQNDLRSFLSKVPAADRTPTPISAQLLQLLLDPHADWTCPTWRPRFRAIFEQA